MQLFRQRRTLGIGASLLPPSLAVCAHRTTFARAAETLQLRAIALAAAASRTVAVDFDGTLTRAVPYTAGPATAPAQSGIRHAIERVRALGLRVVVLTARPPSECYAWLAHHGILALIDGVTNTKPPAIAYIDDRGIQFTGDWDAVVTQLRQQLATDARTGVVPVVHALQAFDESEPRDEHGRWTEGGALRIETLDVPHTDAARAFSATQPTSFWVGPNGKGVQSVSGLPHARIWQGEKKAGWLQHALADGWVRGTSVVDAEGKQSLTLECSPRGAHLARAVLQHYGARASRGKDIYIDVIGQTDAVGNQTLLGTQRVATLDDAREWLTHDWSTTVATRRFGAAAARDDQPRDAHGRWINEGAVRPTGGAWITPDNHIHPFEDDEQTHSYWVGEHLDKLGITPSAAARRNWRGDDPEQADWDGYGHPLMDQMMARGWIRQAAPDAYTVGREEDVQRVRDYVRAHHSKVRKVYVDVVRSGKTESRTFSAAHDVSDEPRDAQGQWTDDGAGSVETLSVRETHARAYNRGDKPTRLKTKLSKHETGRLGEQLAIAYLHAQGHTDARHMNTRLANFPVDLIQDHEVIEVKAGLVSNGPSARQWRLTLGEPSPGEAKRIATMSAAQLERYNAKKQARVHARKEQVLHDVAEKIGHAVAAKTITFLINPDTRRADVYVFEGWHDRVGWHSEHATAAYVTTLGYKPARAKRKAA